MNQSFVSAGDRVFIPAFSFPGFDSIPGVTLAKHRPKFPTALRGLLAKPLSKQDRQYRQGLALGLQAVAQSTIPPMQTGWKLVPTKTRLEVTFSFFPPFGRVAESSHSARVPLNGGP